MTNSSSTVALDSKDVAADTQGDDRPDQTRDSTEPGRYDRLTWGVGDVEVTGYVPTRRDLYILACEHAGDAIYLDAVMCLGGRCQDKTAEKYYAEDRIASIRSLIGSPLTDQAIRDAVQLACRGGSDELWEEYRQMRLRWLPSPWGLGEPDPPPDAWLHGGPEKCSADTRGDSPTDQRDALIGPRWYDAAGGGEGDVEITGYVPTRRDLYVLAREHAGRLIFLDFAMTFCFDRHDISEETYVKNRLNDICRLIGFALAEKAVRDAVQLACRMNKGRDDWTGKEDWDKYVDKRLRWLPSPWGPGEQGSPPDAWLHQWGILSARS
jgi:hypothetical protein